MNKKLIGSMLLALTLVGCATKTEVKKEVVKETPATSQKAIPASSSSTTPSSSVEEPKIVLTDIDKKTRVQVSRTHLYNEDIEKEFLDPKSEQALATAERYHALVQAIGANYFAYDDERKEHYRSLAAQNTPPEFVSEEARQLYEADMASLLPGLDSSPTSKWYHGLSTVHELTQEGYVINPEKTVIKVFDVGRETERVGVVMEKRVGDTLSDSVGFVFQVEGEDGLPSFIAVITENSGG